MIFASYPDDFRHKRKIIKEKYNFDPYNALLAIATKCGPGSHMYR